jgi:hypothetical protein
MKKKDTTSPAKPKTRLSEEKNVRSTSQFY